MQSALDNPESNAMHHRRIEGLDLFRGVVALAVVLYHFRGYLSIPWMGFAYIAVDLFFVLSGIVLGMKYTDAIANGMPILTFARIRLQRLYPMVVVVGAFVAVLNLLGVAPGFAFPASNHAVWRIFALWPLSEGPVNEGAFPVDGPMWSLWAELAVNALWFPIVRYRRRWIGAVGVLAMLGMLVLTWHLRDLNYGMAPGGVSRLMALLRALAWFSVGCWIGRRDGRRVLPVLASLALFLGMIVAAVLTGHGGYRSHLLIVVAGCVLLHSLYHAPIVWAPLSGISRMLGVLSYPLYLIHAPAGRLLPQDGSLAVHWAGVLLLIIGIAAPAAVVNEWLVGWIHRLAPRRRAAVETVPEVLPTPNDAEAPAAASGP